MLQPIDRLKLTQNATWFACCASITRQRPFGTLSQLACLQQLLVVPAVVVGISSVVDAVATVQTFEELVLFNRGLCDLWYISHLFFFKLVGGGSSLRRCQWTLKGCARTPRKREKMVTTWRESSKGDDG
ncbi:unnamed protein product [Aphanomyces euteiches]